MTEFSKSRWAKSEFTQEYRSNAEVRYLRITNDANERL